MPFPLRTAPTTVDILAFLKDRTTFIQNFYSVASGPFTEAKRKIEGGEAPFEWHLVEHEEEPPFVAQNPAYREPVAVATSGKAAEPLKSSAQICPCRPTIKSMTYQGIRLRKDSAPLFRSGAVGASGCSDEIDVDALAPMIGLARLGGSRSIVGAALGGWAGSVSQ